MQFPYRKFTLPQRSEFFGTSFLRPIIPVTLRCNGREIRYAALVDSGADFNIFHAEIGESIGLKITAGQPMNFGGIQAKTGAIGYFHELMLVVGGHPFKTRVAFSTDIAEFGHGVLGQRGFFDFFKVIFEYDKEVIEIRLNRK